MARKKIEPKRGRTIPIYDERYQWWTDAAKRAWKKRWPSEKAFSLAIGEDPTEVWKCIARQVPTYDLLIKISDALDIPYPVIMPDNEAEAFELAKHRRLLKSDAQIREIKAGASENTQESQTASVVSEHAIRPRKRQPRQRREQAG